MAHGTICVQRSLNHRRAITLCWTAKIASSAQSIASAAGSEVSQRAVEPARHGESADESDRVEERAEEDQIRRERRIAKNSTRLSMAFPPSLERECRVATAAPIGALSRSGWNRGRWL